jgi:regulator of cell morphogenesis and NO signaling
MQEFYTKTIREIAVEFPQTTRVFEEFKIDYCCGGRRPLAEACAEMGLDETLVRQRIESVLGGGEDAEKQTDFPEHKRPAELIDHIVAIHHIFTRNEIARLTPLMEKVRRKHGEQHPELRDIEAVFSALADELLAHMRKEEMVLFPYIKVLAAVVSTSIPIAEPPFRTVQNPVRMMMTEHDAAGEMLVKVRALSNDFTPPDGACPSYRALYYGLEELERDLHRHIHLENNVLFPQAVELEQKVLGETSAAPPEDQVCSAGCH